MLYLLCFFPPIAVLFCGKPGQAMISLLLTICFYIPGVIHAFAVVATHKADKRNKELIKAIEGRR